MIWNIGDIRVTSIVEQALEDLSALIPNATPDAVREIDWVAPDFADADGNMQGLVQCFVIEAGDRQIVVDCCLGDGKDLPVTPNWHKKTTGFMQKFRAAGFDPDRIDLVLCTHMHLDHVGWNTFWDGEAWVPTFPNARYLFASAEFEFWQEENAKPAPQLPKDNPLAGAMAALHQTQLNVHRESIQPVVDAGLADFLATPCEVVPGVRLVPSPGHTPGHVCIALESSGSSALITGDSFHHPCQIARPDWATIADHDQAASTATRKALLGDLADGPVMVIGTHFSRPTAGMIRSDGDRHRFES